MEENEHKSPGVLSYMLREKRSYKYTFDDSEESSSAKQTKVSAWYQKIESLKLKGPDAVDAFKEQERQRIKDVRSRTSEEAKQRNRELQRARQAAYRRRKAEQERQSATRCATAKILMEKTAVKEKHRNYMREWRKNVSDEKRKEINKKRMDRYYAQKAKMASATISASQTKQPSPQEVLAEPQQSCSPLQGSPYKTPEAKRKAASRAKKHEPEDPIKYAELKAYQLEQAMKSPRKQTALAMLGVIRRPDKPKFETNLVDHLTSLKESKRKDDHAFRKKMIKLLIKDSTRSTVELSKQLQQRWHIVAAASMMPEEADALVEIARHGSRLSSDVEELVKDFYKQPESSVVIPDRKMVKKDLVPKHCLTKSTKALHRDFVEQSGKHIGLTKFRQLRPQHVLTVGKLKHTSCVCKSCANVAQKLDALGPELKNAGIQLDGCLQKLVSTTVCEDKKDMTNWSCHFRTCSDCGVAKLSSLLASLDAKKKISWLRWQMDGQRMINITKQGCVEDLVEELVTEVGPLAAHLAVARWQWQQFRQLKSTLGPMHLLTMMDFAENYRCEYQQEVQAAHWSYSQVTVFPTVNYYRCATCPSLVTESVTIISADLEHDASAVHHYNSLVVQHLQQRRHLKIEKQFQFTDGAASQFKSREPFMDVSHSYSDHGFGIERSFFGSSHGKGPCDGVGGMVKAAARQAVLSGKVMIRDAPEMFRHLKDSITEDPEMDCCHHRKIFFYVDKVFRNRSGRRPKNAVRGTRQIHTVQASAGSEIFHRELSCYCIECIRGGCCLAMKQLPQGRWRKHKFLLPSQPAPPPQQPSSPPPQQPSSPPQQPSSPPQQPSSPPQQLSSPPAQQLSSPPQPPLSPPPQQFSSPQQRSSSPHQQLSLPPHQQPSHSLQNPDISTHPPVKDAIKTLASCKDFTSFQSAACGIAEHLEQWPLQLKEPQIKKCKLDKVALSLSPSDHTTFIPLEIYGDGNCLPRCGSLLTYGCQSHFEEMRLRIAVELAANKEYYVSENIVPEVNLPKFIAQYSEFYTDEVLTPLNIGKLFEMEVMAILKNGTYMGMWQLMALCSILKAPVFSIYPQYGGATIRPHLHRLLLPRQEGTAQKTGTSSRVPGVMWTHTRGKNVPALVWRPNHFVVCVQRASPSEKAKPGDFVLVGVPKDSSVVTYPAQITKLTEEGLWGVYLKRASPSHWKWPQDNPAEYFVPEEDILTLLTDYDMKLDHRAVLYKFGLV